MAEIWNLCLHPTGRLQKHPTAASGVQPNATEGLFLVDPH